MGISWAKTKLTVSVTALAIVLSGCTSGTSQDPQSDPVGDGDDGTTLTMWARSATEPTSSLLVERYNSTHKNQVKLTIIPNENYQPRVGAAAGADNLPDILVSQTGYVPSYTKNGLWIDISDRIDALPYAKDIAPSHLKVSSIDGKNFGVPYLVDLSLMLYNKDLFKQAGLDPEDPPSDFAELLDAARATNALSDQISGFYMAGNCGSCNSFTMFPYAWADGVDVFSDDGTKANFDNETFRKIFALYKTAWDEGLMPRNAETDDGSTWADGFVQGRTAIQALGTFAIAELKKESNFDWGVIQLMSPDGGAASTFVGGDVAGISRSSKSPDAAWNFIEWTLSEDAQIEVLAKNGLLPTRTDLTDNEYTSEDPRVKLVADTVALGHTPFVIALGEVINSANGPWLAMIRGAIFGDDPDSAIVKGQQQIQAGLDATK